MKAAVTSETVRPFLERLVAAVGATGPLCAGIDPSPQLLAQWGLPDTAEGLHTMSRHCLEAFTGVVPVVKAQVAFFERHGSAGLAVLESVVGEATSAGLLVIADAKRSDIASTVEAYAEAWLAPSSALGVDAVTAVPYFGLPALEPMIAMAAASGRAVVVVARSSNPEGALVQEARTAAGTGVAEELLRQIAERNAAECRQAGAEAGPVGAVVGATMAPPGFPMADLGGVVLAPGVGAQGAGPADVARLFAGCRPGTVLPNVSRSVLAAGPDPAALRSAARRARDEMAAALA